MNPKAPELLEKAAVIYRERNAVYGDNFRNYPAVMEALFPSGVVLHDYDDHIRMQMLSLIVVKLTRYANNWKQGGHVDSLDDIMVYAAMLQQVDGEIQQKLTSTADGGV